VERPLTAREHVRMPGVESEAGASILQRKAHAFDRYTRTEIAEDALNPAHDVSVTVDYREIDCVAAGYPPSADFAIGLLGIDQRSPLARVFFGEQLRHRHVAGPRV